jgi:hypothetical protein
VAARGGRDAKGDFGARERRVTSDLDDIQTRSAWLNLLILARRSRALLRPRHAD